MRHAISLSLAWCLALAASQVVFAQGQAQPPAPAPASAAQAPASGFDSLGSLFEPAPNQLQLGGRWTSESGDPARFQRYGDYRSGLLFTDARFTHADPAGAWVLRAAADNVGWRDQRFIGSYERTGRFVVAGSWDQIPQFYSVDTRTPYATGNGVLTLDDATQRAVQAGQANLSAYVPIAGQFDLR